MLRWLGMESRVMAPSERRRSGGWWCRSSGLAAGLGLLTATTWCMSPVLAQDRTTGSGVTVPAPEGGSQPAPVPPDDEAGGLLSLPELEQMALSWNPSLMRASARIGAVRGNQVQVGLKPNPVLGYEGQQIGSRGLAEQHGIAIGQEIVRGGKLRWNRAVAAQEIVRTEQEYAVQQQRVLTDVRISYFQVLLAQRQVELTSDLVRINEQGAKAVDTLFQGKEASRADVLQAQLEVESARINAQNARQRFQAAWRSLAAVVGNPQLSQQGLAGDVYEITPELEFDAVLSRLQTESPEIAVASAEIERARAALQRAQVERVQNVTVQGVINVRDNGIGGRSDGSIGVSMPIPVFDRNQGGVMKAQHEVVAAERALEQVGLDLQTRLAPTYERYSTARNQAQRYREAILPAALETLDLTRKMYRAGEVGFLSFLTALRTYSQTNLNYLEALRELHVAEAEIQGQLLSGSLSNAPGQ